MIQAGDVHEGGEEVDEGDEFVGDDALLEAGAGDDEGDAGGGFVKGVFEGLAVFHVHFAVVAGEDDVGVVELAGGFEGVVELAGGFEGVEDLAEHGVGFGDHGEVVAADGEDFLVGEVAVGVFGDAHVVHDGVEVGFVRREGDSGGVDCVEPVLGGAEGGMGDVGAGVAEVGRVVV